MRAFFLATTVAVGLAGCYTDQAAPKAAQIFPSASPALTATAGATPSSAPATTSAATPATPEPAPAATSSTEVGDMSNDGNRNIVIANYLAKAIVSPFPVTGWDAARVFAELSSGSVAPYVAGSFLGSPAWNSAPQNAMYYGRLSSGNLVVPLPTDSDIDGGNIAFAASGSTWTQVAWSSSQGPRNYLSYYGLETKFRWSGWKLIKR